MVFLQILLFFFLFFINTSLADFFFGREVYPWDLLTPDGGPLMFLDPGYITPKSSRMTNNRKAAFALNNRLLDHHFGRIGYRYAPMHAPFVWDKRVFQDIETTWPKYFHHTAHSKSVKSPPLSFSLAIFVSLYIFFTLCPPAGSAHGPILYLVTCTTITYCSRRNTLEERQTLCGSISEWSS